MAGTVISVASLTICLAMTTTSAFVLRVPKVNPPHPAWSKQASSSLDRPLGDDGGKMGAGGALSRGGVNDDAEPKKGVLPRVPSPEGYSGLRSRSTSPLHVFKGVEPGITQDGNTTVPIGGRADEEEEEDSGPEEMLQDGAQDDDEELMQRRVSVTLDALSSHFNFWGTDMRITGNALEAYESGSMTPEEGDDSAHGGVSDDADLATDTNFEGRDSSTDGTGFNEESLLDPADDDEMDEMSAETVEDADDDEMRRSMPHDSDGNAADEEIPFDLVAGNLIDEMSFGAFGERITGYAAYDPLFDEPAPEALEMASKAAIIDDRVNAMVWSVIEEALAGRDDSDDGMFEDDAMDKLLWSMMHDALAGRAISKPVNLHDTLDEMVTSMLEYAFFGPAASKIHYSSHGGKSEDAPMFTPEIAIEFGGDDSPPKVGGDHNPSSAVDGDHQAGDSSSGGEAPVVRKARKGGLKWVRKIWARVRRKGQ